MSEWWGWFVFLNVKLCNGSFISNGLKKNFLCYFLFNSWHFGLAIAKYPKAGTETQRILHSTSCEAFAWLVQVKPCTLAKSYLKIIKVRISIFYFKLSHLHKESITNPDEIQLNYKMSFPFSLYSLQCYDKFV